MSTVVDPDCLPQRKRKRTPEWSTLDDKSLKKLSITKAKSDYICEACSQIDFEKVLRLDSVSLGRAKNGVLIANLGFRFLESSPILCTLCRLWEAAASNLIDDDALEELELRAYSVLQFSPWIQYYFCPKDLRLKDQPYLAVVPQESSALYAKFLSRRFGQIHCYSRPDQDRHIYAPQILPKNVDLSIVTQWLEHCRSRHDKLCGGTVAQSPNLKVIDCISLSVVAAPPSCPYAALSYVWSKANRITSSIEQHHNRSLAQQLKYGPKTIPDALEVTRRLGLQYLWIDRFCIDQQNAEDKHDQIQNMDRIYKGAEFTIVAMAGEDEEYGLPGIGITPRAPQLRAKLPGIHVVCTMPHPHFTIKNSKWATRGWTYQEAVLSRRRIVFTDHQIYFECNAMNCCESMKGNLNVLHTKNRYKSLRMLHSGVLAGREGSPYNAFDMDNLSLKASLDRYQQLIVNYSGRSLTFEKDYLNAFTGIARHLATSKFSIFHLSGLPFPSPIHLCDSQDNRTYLSLSLLWVHDQYDSSGLATRSRRSLFPSWSWTGWDGKVGFLRDDILGFSSTIHTVHFEFEPCCLVEQSYFLDTSNLDELQARSPRGLHLYAPVVFPEGVGFSEATPRSWQLAGRQTALYLSRFQSENREDAMVIVYNFRKKQWLLVLVSEYVNYLKNEVKRYYLVVSQRGSFMSRVGVVVVTAPRGEDCCLGETSLSHIRLL